MRSGRRQMRTVDTAVYRIELRNKKNKDKCEFQFDAQSGDNVIKVFERMVNSLPTQLTQEHIQECFEQLEQENGNFRNLKIHLKDGPLSLNEDKKGIYGYGQIKVVKLAETSAYTDRDGRPVFRAIPEEHLRQQKHVFFIGISKHAPVGYIFCERLGLYYLAKFIETYYRQQLSTVYADKMVKIEPHISSTEIAAAKEYGYLRDITLTKKIAPSDLTDIDKIKERPVDIRQQVTMKFPKLRIKKEQTQTVRTAEKEMYFSDIESFIIQNPDVAGALTFSGLGDFTDARFTVEYQGGNRSFRLGEQKRFSPVYEVKNVEEITEEFNRGDIKLSSWCTQAKAYFFQILQEQGLATP